MFTSSHRTLSVVNKCLQMTSLALYVYYMLYETASNPQICLECDSAPTRVKPPYNQSTNPQPEELERNFGQKCIIVATKV